ncbi:uncharacterized protein LOC143906691 [Temnothorax americanus]|uniref:uncharacterized protein LOC143906691 n=1 Tax=Temnothorax americanus TaxID=1964332 RepID=UPI00406921E3
MSSSKFKCGYCRWIVWFDEDGKLSHPCLANHANLIMDKDRNLFINDSLETHVKSENNSTACEKENIAQNRQEHTDDHDTEQNRQEHTDDHDTEKLDEDLISAVKERAPLYDFRIPVKERGRKQKDCLWQEVSKCLKGLYTATEAEKRWTYLKDCYRKALLRHLLNLHLTFQYRGRQCVLDGFEQYFLFHRQCCYSHS